jgi:hypothetical protein
LPSANVVRLSVRCIIERRQETNLLLGGANAALGNSTATAPTSAEPAASPAATPAPSPLSKASGSVAEHMLAMELAIDHGHPAIAADILKRLARRSLRGQDQKFIAEMILERGDLSAKQVQGTPWADWAECVEQALACLRTESQQKLRGELALWGARCHIRAGQYDHSIRHRLHIYQTVRIVVGFLDLPKCFSPSIGCHNHPRLKNTMDGGNSRMSKVFWTRLQFSAAEDPSVVPRAIHIVRFEGQPFCLNRS